MYILVSCFHYSKDSSVPSEHVNRTLSINETWLSHTHISNKAYIVYNRLLHRRLLDRPVLFRGSTGLLRCSRTCTLKKRQLQHCKASRTSDFCAFCKQLIRGWPALPLSNFLLSITEAHSVLLFLQDNIVLCNLCCVAAENNSLYLWIWYQRIRTTIFICFF